MTQNEKNSLAWELKKRVGFAKFVSFVISAGSERVAEQVAGTSPEKASRDDHKEGDFRI